MLFSVDFEMLERTQKPKHLFLNVLQVMRRSLHVLRFLVLDVLYALHDKSEVVAQLLASTITQDAAQSISGFVVDETCRLEYKEHFRFEVDFVEQSGPFIHLRQLLGEWLFGWSQQLADVSLLERAVES